MSNLVIKLKSIKYSKIKLKSLNIDKNKTSINKNSIQMHYLYDLLKIT